MATAVNLVNLEAATAAVDAHAQRAIGQACAGDGGLGAVVVDPVIAGVAMCGQCKSRAAMHEGEVPLAGMTQPPAVGDRPG